MEEKSEGPSRSLEQEQGKNIKRVTANTQVSAEKSVTKSKKEALRLKKNHKKTIKTQENHQISNNDHKEPSDNQLNARLVDSTQLKVHLQQKDDRPIQARISPSIDKLLTRPPYITVTHNNRIIGSFGHSTAFFRRPLLQGHAFLEFILVKDSQIAQKILYPSAVRVGICPISFNPSFPLGFEESIGYKSVDGSIIRKGQVIQRTERFNPGDVVGVGLKLRPPAKHPNSQKISEGSSVTFFKNGRKVGAVSGLHQMFYCLGVSLFNYAQVQIVREQSLYPMPEESVNYFSILNEPVPYKDLQSKKIFKV